MSLAPLFIEALDCIMVRFFTDGFGHDDVPHAIFPTWNTTKKKKLTEDKTSR
jgi:hypothetical protein